jgi:hypothetical protein
MAPKKRPQPLHKSLRLIEEERANAVKRTQVRIAQLIAEEEANVVPDEEANVVPDDDWHCCLNTFCFCMLLVLILMNLLFLQWLYVYYKVHDFKLKQL